MKRRISFVAILLLFLGLAAWWVFYFPFNRERLYRSIPSNAILISEHRHLASRWDDVAKHSLVTGLCEMLGADASGQNSSAGRLIKSVASKDTIVAYTSSVDDIGTPAWVLSSWAGYRVYGLRRMAERHADAEFTVSLFGTEVISLLKPIEDSEWSLSIALVEGVLVACFSPDPLAVTHIVGRIYGTPSLAPDLLTALEKEKDIAENAGNVPNDRGWWLKEKMRGVVYQRARLIYDINTSDSISGVVKPVDGLTVEDLRFSLGDMVMRETWFQAKRPVEVGDADQRDVQNLRAVLKDSPCAFSMVPFSVVKPMFFLGGRPRSVGQTGAMLVGSMKSDALCFVSVCNSEYDGRMMDIKAPTLLMGIQLKNPEQWRELIQRWLDSMNAIEGLGLVQQEIDLHGEAVLVLDNAKNEGLWQPKPLERPAFIMKGNWLIMISNMGALEKMLANQTTEEGSTEACWSSDGIKAESRFIFWADMVSSQAQAGKVLGWHDILSRVSDFERNSELRRVLVRIRNSAEAMSRFRSGSVWARAGDGDGAEVAFRLGTRSDSGK
jgi:hypothetical protein